MLGLDLGTKTIGMATSDLTGQMADPRETIRRTKFMADAKALLAFADEGRHWPSGDGPAAQHGWIRGPTGPGDPRLCA